METAYMPAANVSAKTEYFRSLTEIQFGEVFIPEAKLRSAPLDKLWDSAQAVVGRCSMHNEEISVITGSPLDFETVSKTKLALSWLKTAAKDSTLSIIMNVLQLGSSLG
jgi:hypothetical protein